MPAVMDVAVVPVPDHDRDEEAKAIVVLHAGAQVSAVDIAAWAGERLAPFKVPRYVEFRSELPTTGNGKIAKTQLRNEPPLAEGVIDTRKAQASR
jgi:acyl-CoA synthetase (AMP-forming)/AMP-acid ligase II